MRAITSSVVALVLCILLGICAVTSAQTSSPTTHGLSVCLWAWFRFRPMERLRGDDNGPAAEPAAARSATDVPPAAGH